MSPNIFIFLAALPLLLAAVLMIIGTPKARVLQLLAVAIPLESFAAIEAGFTIPPAYLVLLAVICGMLLKGERVLTTVPAAKLFLVYLAVAAVATIVADITAAGLPDVQVDDALRFRAAGFRSPLQLMLLFFHFSLFFLIVSFIRDRDSAHSLLKVYLVMGGFIAAIAVYQVLAFVVDLPFKDVTWSLNLVDNSAVHNYSETRYYSARVTNFSPRATFPESRDLAEYILSVVPIAMAIFLSTGKTLRKRFGMAVSPVLILLGLVAIFLAMSRSAWIALLLALIVIVIYLKPAKVLKYLPVTLGLIVVVTLVFIKVGFFSSADGSLFSIFSGRLNVTDIVFDPRVLYFSALWESFTANPILGVGAGNYAIIAANMLGYNTLISAHGFPWLTLAEFGLAGLLVLAVAVVTVIKRLMRAIRRCDNQLDRAIMVGLLASLTALLFESLFGGDRPRFHFLFILGMSAVYPYLRELSPVIKRSYQTDNS